MPGYVSGVGWQCVTKSTCLFISQVKSCAADALAAIGPLVTASGLNFVQASFRWGGRSIALYPSAVRLYSWCGASVYSYSKQAFTGAFGAVKDSIAAGESGMVGVCCLGMTVG